MVRLCFGEHCTFGHAATTFPCSVKDTTKSNNLAVPSPSKRGNRTSSA